MTRSAIVLAALALLAACDRTPSGPGEPQAPATTPAPKTTVLDVTLGRSLTPEQTIGDTTDSFLPNDTVYVTVKTQGTAPSAVLRARWTGPDGQVIEDTRQSVTPSEGGATSEFHASRPDGWPPGEYRIEILVDGELAQTRMFRVS